MKGLLKFNKSNQIKFDSIVFRVHFEWEEEKSIDKKW